MSNAKNVLAALRKTKIDVTFLEDDNSPCTVSKWISTGCIALDAIMGGGMPIGRLVEMYGENSTGKSLIAAQIAAEAQRQGMVVAYVDTETAVSKVMMAKLGVNIKELIYYAPDTVEEIFKFFEDTVCINTKINPDCPILLIWDSVAASSTEHEMEEDYGKAMMASHARLISQSLRKFTRIMSRQNVSMLFLNQAKENIGVMWGDKVATMGGSAIKFHASIRIQLDLSSKIKVDHHKSKRVVGMNTRATCVKNKLAVPFMVSVLPIHFGYGIDDAFATMEFLLENDMMVNDKGRFTLTIDDTEYKNTRKTWRQFFDDNYDVLREVIMASIDSDTNTNLEDTTNEVEK
jgi:recombination protein RecA